MNKNNQKISLREEIPKKYRWDIESLYSTKEDWEQDYQKAEQLRKTLLQLKEKITKDAQTFFQCLQLKDEISELLQKIFTYAHMRKDEDNRNNFHQSIYYKASSLLVKIEDSMSFIQPAILSLDRNVLRKWMEEIDSLQLYRHYLDSIHRKKEHILSPAEERIIARSGEMAMVPENVFNMLSNADLKFPGVNDDDGNTVFISHSNFITLLRNRNREFRKKVFKKYYQSYKTHRNTFASLLAGNLKRDHFFSTVKKYNNSLEAALFEDNIPLSVYKNLLDTVHKNIGLLQKYTILKKEYLELDKFHMYDMYVPIVEKALHINYEQASKIVIKSLAPLGKSYQEILKKGFAERWIDVYENQGKTSGAYSSGSYRSKPFILLNYQGTMEDVYTLVHELGHSLHSYYTNKTQPYIYSDYPIFLAEIASTTNEALLTHYLLDWANNRTDKLVVLNHFLEQFRTTFFRQAMFAEFEMIIHEYEEQGGSLTAEWCSQKYIELIRYYYGEGVIIDKDISMEWARIPHFYYNYYVYQYATGFAAAIAFSRKILDNGDSAVKEYIGFLSKGNSDYPIDILKQAGIDMTNNYPLTGAMELFSELLTQLENLKS
jgi:oligoendopeptidase F